MPDGLVLPVGTVSFLFTDIEGSTRLLQMLGREDFASVIDDHNAILRGVVGSAEISTEGDAFFCAFESAFDAVQSAVSVQRLLREHAWPGAGEVRVRIGIHTGEGRLGGDNYVGLDVHKASRIASAAHGGQVLISDATRTLVEHSLPDGISLLDLGEHQLKDLSRPEHLFQLRIDGLRSDFPVINSIGKTLVRLPDLLTDFIGRESEIHTLIETVAEARLVTLVGIGGSGKTRLAIEAGRKLAQLSYDGVVFVSLVDASDAVEAAKAVAAELSLVEQVGRPIEATLVDYLNGRSDLLIFDNCEQVADEAAALVERLLHSCPQLKVLATSREALRIAGERVVSVGPMRLPDPRRPEETFETDAVQLFVSRATQANPDFEPERWLEEIAAVCRRLEGIPLALELAAARMGMLSPAEILKHLEDSFSLLRSRSRSGERRHETLEAAMEWSYRLLDEELQRLLCWLSIFRGGFTIDAVHQICFDSAVDAIEVLDHLTELGDKSLLVSEVGFTETRFRLLETIRDFAGRRLDQLGDYDDANTEHRHHFSSFVREQTRRLGGAEQLEALALLEADHDNLRAVIRRAIDEGDTDAAADVAGRLTWFWYVHAHFTEGERWADELLQSIPVDPDRPWLRLLIGAAQYDWRIGEYERADDRLRVVLEVTTRKQLPRLEMWAHAYLATNEMYRIEMDMALAEAERALQLAGSEGDLIGWGYATYLHVTAESWLLETSNRLTPERAHDLVTRLAPVTDGARTAGDRNMIGHVLQTEGILLARIGDTERASTAFDDAIVAFTELGTVGCACHCLESIAGYASSTGHHRPAVKLIGASDQLRDEVGITIAPVEQHLRNEAMKQILTALPPAIIEAETTAGQQLSLPEASQLARQILTDI